jgi:hypothetical protein
VAFSLACTSGMITFISPVRLFGIWVMTLAMASESEPWTLTISAVCCPMSKNGVNRDVGCDAAYLAGAGGCIVSLIGNRDDLECQSGSMSMMEPVSILVCVWGHKDAGRNPSSRTLSMAAVFHGPACFIQAEKGMGFSIMAPARGSSR